MVKLIVAGFELDLPIDFGIQINKEIADIRDPDNRNSDWTQTFSLPGSKINKKAFTHLFELNTKVRNVSSTNHNPDFNPNLKAPAKLYVDEVIQISGFIRLQSIEITDNNSMVFKCTLHGQLSDLFTTISEAKLNELDFTEYNHTLNAANITDSWNGTIQKDGANFGNFTFGVPDGVGYVHGLIDDGTYINYYGDTHVAQFYPQLYAKEIVDKIFTFAGYTYTSDSIFNETFFKRLTVPPPGSMVLNAADATERLFEAQPTITQTVTAAAIINFGTENFDYGNQFSSPRFTSNTDGASFDFYFYNNSAITGLSNGTTYDCEYYFLVNGIVANIFSCSLLTNGSGNGTIDQTVIIPNINLNNGDYCEIKLNRILIPSILVATGWSYSQNVQSKFYNGIVSTSWGNGNPVDFASFFQGDITQREFLKSIFIAFNLYAEPDPDFPTKLFVQTRDEFYRNTTQDWTRKLDISQEFTLIPMGELEANPYTFSYTRGEDGENKDYQESYGRIYGDKKYFIDNDFINKEKKIELIFAPSQFRQLPGWDKYLTHINTSENGGTGQLRLLYFAGVKVCNSYGIYDSDSMTGTFATEVEYPLTLHIDNVEEPTLDLCFGMPRRINLPSGTPYTNNNLFNRYWSKYINEITSKDSKIFKGYFDITPADIEKLSFRDLYYFEDNYFRLNKINNYNPIVSNVTECEFLYLSEAPVFTASSGHVGTDQYDNYGGDGFPARVTKKQIDNSYLGQAALVVGRSNKSGFQNLIVGDRIGTARDTRINAAIASVDCSFETGVERSTVLNSSGQTISESDKLMINGAYVDFSPTTNGYVLKYNSATNTWEGQPA